MKFYSLKIVNVRQETSDCVTVIFKQPGLKPIKYLAGQYLSLIFRINTRRYIRPYSLSSAPGVDETLNITVKRVPGGVVSNHIIDKLKVGDIVEVMEPLGEFILENNSYKEPMNLFLWGAGSGITPLISIAKYALHHKKAKSVSLIYANRDFERVIFKHELTILKSEYLNLLDVTHFITAPLINEPTPSVVGGRITPKDVTSIVASKPDNEQCLHYICGPVDLKESIKSVLMELGFKNNHIFTEDFEAHRNPKDFENIHTQTVSLIKEGKTNKIEVASGKSILEAGLDALLELSYSCQTGNCLVCRAKVAKGDVKMIGIEKLPELLREDECLLCSSFPMTDDVEIIIEQ